MIQCKTQSLQVIEQNPSSMIYPIGLGINVTASWPNLQEFSEQKDPKSSSTLRIVKQIKRRPPINSGIFYAPPVRGGNSGGEKLLLGVVSGRLNRHLTSKSRLSLSSGSGRFNNHSWLGASGCKTLKKLQATKRNSPIIRSKPYKAT